MLQYISKESLASASLERWWIHTSDGSSGTMFGMAGQADLGVTVCPTLGADVVWHWTVSLASGLPFLVSFMHGFRGGAAYPPPHPFLENFTKEYEKKTEMNIQRPFFSPLFPELGSKLSPCNFLDQPLSLFHSVGQASLVLERGSAAHSASLLSRKYCTSIIRNYCFQPSTSIRFLHFVLGCRQ